VKTFFNFFFFFFFLVIATDRIRNSFKQKEKGKVYGRWISNILISSYILIVTLGILEYFLSHKEIIYFVSLFGLLLFIFARYSVNYSIRTLGKFWSLGIEIFENQNIIKDGPYGYSRHPYHLSVIFEMLGFLLLLNSFNSCLILFFVHFPMLMLRIKIEEDILTDVFKEEYIEYRRSVGIVPKNLIIKLFNKTCFKK